MGVIYNAEPVELLPLLARTVAPTVVTEENRWYNGVLLNIEVTAIAATPTITPTIRHRDPVIGVQSDLWTAAAGITATGSYMFMLVPGASGTPSGDLVELLGIAIPRNWDLIVAHADTDSITYHVSVQYLLG